MKKKKNKFNVKKWIKQLFLNQILNKKINIFII